MVSKPALDNVTAVMGGGLFIFGLSPFDWWPAVMMSQGVLAYHWHRRPERAAVLSYLFGVGLFSAGASWVYVSIHVYGNAETPLAVCLTTIFCLGLATLFALQGMCYQFWLASNANGLLLGFPALWVIFEWLRSWLLTGFPWLYAGYASLDTPLAPLAPIVGVFGLSYLFCSVAVWVVLISCSPCRRNILAGSGLFLSMGFAVALAPQEWTHTIGEPLEVALFQPNIPLEQKWQSNSFRTIIQQYEASIDSLPPSTDLVLWPEAAIPAYQDVMTQWLTNTEQSLSQNETGLITGIPLRSHGSRYNGVIGIGTAEGEYRKQKLVPFGEYVPLESWLRGLIDFFDLPMSHMAPGESDQTGLAFRGLSIAPFICYEVVYPDFVAAGSRGSHFIVTISNDSWFGDSIGPLQHLQMARFRALETGRPVLRGTNNGVTAIINHRGEIIGQLPQFESGTLEGSIIPRTGHTPFMHFYSYPILTFAILSLIYLRWRRD